MKNRELNLLVKNAEAASEGLKALAHPSRLLAVCFIGEAEKTVTKFIIDLRTKTYCA